MTVFVLLLQEIEITNSIPSTASLNTEMQLLRAVGGISLWIKSVLATSNMQEKLIDGDFSKINQRLMELLH